MDKTPHDVAKEVYENYMHFGLAGRLEMVASAVVEHIRPQIEAEARAAALDEAFALLEQYEVEDAMHQISELADAARPK